MTDRMNHDMNRLEIGLDRNNTISKHSEDNNCIETGGDCIFYYYYGKYHRIPADW